MDIFTYVSAQAVRYFLTRSPTLCAAGLGGVLVKSCVFVSIPGELMTAVPCPMRAPAEPNTRSANSADINYVYRSIIITQHGRPAHRHEEKAFWTQRSLNLTYELIQFSFSYFNVLSCSLLIFESVELNWMMTEKRIKSFSLHSLPRKISRKRTL